MQIPSLLRSWVGKALAFLPFNLSESVLIEYASVLSAAPRTVQSWLRDGQSVAAEAGLFIAENRTESGRKSTVAQGGDAPA